MIPLGDLNPTRRFAWVTLAIIAVNVAVFLLWEPTFKSESVQTTFLFCQAEIPYEVTHQVTLAHGGVGAREAMEAALGVDPETAAGDQAFLRDHCPHKSWLASIFVSMFLHGGWLHIAGNMLFLWVFGNNVEDRLGRVTYLVFYVLGGLAATGLQLAFGPNSAVPNLGASGAIAAILGSYLVLSPRAKVKTLVIFYFITFLELPAVVVLGAWFVLQLFSGVGGLGTQGTGGGVAYWAHVGGFVFGMAATWLLFRGRSDRVQPTGIAPRPDLY